jgi:hypothetical protein
VRGTARGEARAMVGASFFSRRTFVDDMFA